MLVHERTGWGWLTWTVPGDGTLPHLPRQIGVLTPGATLTQRLWVRWLTRRPAHRIALTTQGPVSLRPLAAAVAIISLVAAAFALNRGIPAGLVLPAMLLAPLLAEHLPDRLDARASEHVRRVEGDAACRYLQRLVALHTCLVQAASDSDRYDLHRSAEIGHTLLWDAADLLHNQDTSSAAARLIDRERLMVQLADQVAQTMERTRAEPASREAGRPRAGEGPWGPLPHGFPPAARPTPSPSPAADTPPLKGHPPTTQSQPDDAARTTDVYLLFAHEPYYPADGTQEINTTVVRAASLLHPRVQQPDGARIHHRLTQGRPSGAIIPLSTLTHELGGGAGWPYVGDWEKVTTDLVQLVHARECDALSLGLPEIARALVCTGPHSHMSAFDAAADEFITYGPKERAAVLAEVDRFLTCLVAEQDLWPGDGLLPPLSRHA
ncbi:hypothetical protein [Streptomyces cylindrosporus]|uniref:Uncharacterized protein n=1 Tax=Streptomyces cylindrosporus TaxID=2927583 RepID=A0ABS9YIG5_9ACTN|nr:hypothetical protein [Streptomyces cylindrosporus]MCI3276969.1 hypothetical protein [Streptomyces cylindrosporus]